MGKQIANSTSLVTDYGQMWARNSTNIQAIPWQKAGVYILFDGSMPLYVGKGHLRSRIQGARRSKSRSKHWDYFSWYAVDEASSRHDLEVLFLRILPFYLRVFNRQRGKFLHAEKHREHDKLPELVQKLKFAPQKKRAKR
jgi:hypothetical protein